VGVLLGAALGALLAGSPGGVLGAFCGAALGLGFGSVRPSRARAAGQNAHCEEHSVVCISRGEVARCLLWRDDETGEFVDVESCSLEPPGVRPRCAKRCLELLPGGLPRSAPAVPPAAAHR
jgi:hypothetical protein